MWGTLPPQILFHILILEPGDMTHHGHPGITSREIHTVTPKQHRPPTFYSCFLETLDTAGSYCPPRRPPIVSIKGGTFWSLDNSSELHHGCRYVVLQSTSPLWRGKVTNPDLFMVVASRRCSHSCNLQSSV